MSTILDTILATKREELAHDRALIPLPALEKSVASAPPTKPFASALRHAVQAKGVAVIAEIKKASPSQGVIRPDFDAVAIAQDYAHHGATCLSVLTDEKYFQGSSAILQSVQKTVDTPILRKDFTIDRYHIAQARVWGADAILLIVAALSDKTLMACLQAARDYGVHTLIEVHDKDELMRALCLPLGEDTMIGVNNRDLKTFRVSLDTIINLRPHIPDEQIGIGESGIKTRADIERLKAHQINTYLIGESLMREPSPGVALRHLLD